MKKLFLFTLLLMYSVLLVAQDKPSPVSPFDNGNMFARTTTQSNGNMISDGAESILDAFTTGGNRLVAMQNPNGGWGWPLTGTSALNTIGPITMGLAQAYQQTGLSTHRTALLNAGALLLTKTNNFSPSDGYLAATLDKVLGVTTYTTHVKTNFYDQLAAGTYDKNGLGTLYNTSDYINLVRTNRAGTQANMAAWDVGMGLVGAAMCGASTSEWIDGVKAEINELDGNAWYDVIGLAGAVYGLAYVNEDFDPTAGWHIAASNINDLAATLATYQIVGGGFTWNQAYVIPGDLNESIQETAYSILALNEVNRTLYLTNIEGAADYMMSVQLGTGGWSNDQFTISENNEVTGEALWGISVAYPAPVYNLTKDVYYPTIQGAINDATAGNTISVAAGTYAENLILNKSITILGPNELNSPNTDTRVLEAILKPQIGGHAILANANDMNIVIKGITIDMVDAAIIDNRFVELINRTNTSWLFENNIFTNAYECNNGNWYITGNTNPFSLTLTDNLFDNSAVSNGISLWSTNIQTINIQNNVWLDNGGWAMNFNNVVGTIANNTIKNTTISGPNWYDDQAGIILASAGNNVTLNSNTFDLLSASAINIYPNYGGTLTGTSNVFKNIQGSAIKVRKEGEITGDISNVSFNNNSLLNNTLSIENLAPGMFNAENNWWGTAVESEIQAMISGPVDYDPWIGKAETINISQATPVVYDFPLAGVKMVFNTLPSGGGNVTVSRYNEAPTPFPSGYTNVGLWLDITSTMANYSFNVDVSVDVFGIPGFDASTTVMYYNSTTSSWLAVSGGTYLASDPLFGGHPSFSFTTNHFTPFTFINTPSTAYNVYLSSSPTAAAGIIYPNDAWGFTNALYEPNDWDFTSPIELYIVPEIGSVFAASDITIQWDNTLFSYAGVDKTGGIYNGANFQFLYDQLGTTDQVTINASSLLTNNFTITSGNYIAKLNLNILKPGFGAISFTALDFRAYNGAGGQLGVYVTGNNAQVKSYLGDVSSIGGPSTGDGVLDIIDLNLWAGSYWSGPGNMANYKVKYDVGPTNTNTVYGMPITDGRIQFEDLVIFSMSYGLSQNHVYPKLNAQPTEPVELKLGDPIFAGNQTRVPLLVSGGVQNVRAMNLTFAGNFGKLVSVEKGELLTSISNPVMVMNNVEGNQVYVDLAVFGANEFGISTSGEVLTLVFEGNTDININSANVRNILNGAMKVSFSGSVETIPTEFALLQNYPNPFNPSTTISYNLPKQAMVEISVFNALGEKVATLVNELKEAGRYNVELNAAGYSSGIYFYQIKANDFVSVKKMILMK
ncbi:MAG: T9SS type A sorting domain-containing protein [Ignavibacteriales bacterium]|nr:T9SS type A sorting domain-containing protein [Ignavibacteriales bacterium]